MLLSHLLAATRLFDIVWLLLVNTLTPYFLGFIFSVGLRLEK